ncbi:MAG: histidine phosphatase family protein [Methylococcaceae bacterium]|nr:histidine phosphatase family protein [Methylococcaceae bacterium]
MKRELWLLRHGKSDWDSIADDFARPLKKRGERAAKQVGAWMKQQNLVPDLVISSPAKRAIDTAKLVCTAIGLPERDIKQDKHLYQEGFERIKTVLAAIHEEVKTVLLVGHNPDLEDLLLDLVGVANVPNQDKLLPTAAIARLVLPHDWKSLGSGNVTVISIIHPKSLEEDNNQ